MVRVSISLMKVLIFSNFVILCCSAKNDTIKKVKHRINTTECSWKIRGQRYFYGNVTMHEFPDSSYNNGPHKYGVCTFKLGEVLNVTAQVDICGRHSLAIESNSSIFISAALILDWSPERNRSDTWLGGFCSRDYDLNETYGNGPGGGSCYGSAGHGGMGIDFKRGVNDMKHGWRYAFNNSNMLLIGGSSGGVYKKKGSGFSCGGGAIMISSAESVTIDSNISANAFNLNTNDSCIHGGSGGTIIIKAKTVRLTPNSRLVARGASPQGCSAAYSGSGGVIVINGAFINGSTPVPSEHTNPLNPQIKKISYGVVIVNGTSKNRLLPLLTNRVIDWECYRGEKVFNYSVLPDYSVQRTTCNNRCKDCGYRYAVLHVKLCACVNDLGVMIKVNRSNCSLRCFGREQMICGGGTKYYVVRSTNIYLNATLNSSNISTPNSCPRKTPTTNCKYQNMTTLLPSVVSSELATSTNPRHFSSSLKPTTSTNPRHFSSSSKPTTSTNPRHFSSSLKPTTSTNSRHFSSSLKPTTSTNPGNNHSSSKPATFPSANTSPSPSKSSTASINNVNQSSTTSSFTKPSASATTKKLQDLSQVKVTANNSMKVLKELLNLTAEIFAPNELNISLTIFEKVVKNDAISPGSKAESKRIGKIILNIAENLLNNSISSWGALKARGKTSSEIVLKVVEEAAGSLGKSLAVNDTISFNTSHFGLRIDNVDPVHFINQTIVFVGLKIEDKKSDQYFGNDEEAFIPAVLPEAIQGAGPFTLHFLKYRPHSVLMNASLKNSSTESVLLSNIISLSISRPLKKRLNDNVVINFPINKIPTSNAKASCRFLDFGKESDISWSSEGCVVGEEKDGRTACLCNHFTNFAVLTNIEEVPLDEGHREALSWLTYVGCAISLICLLATLFIFAVIKTLVVSDHIWIHCNLIASLVLAQIVFVFGIKATEIKVVCKGVAIALQYLYTTAIFWMFVEGIHLYRKVVKVFVKSSVKKYYYIFGWGGPVIIVFISALSRFDGFGNEKTCWLSIEKGLIWAFVVPVLLVVLLNVIILVAVIRIMLVAVDTMPQSNGQNSSIRNGVKGVIFLLPILGLTWIFGVAAVNDAAIVFQYIFTALNSFQGFFIFLFHCVLNKDVRAAIKKRRLKKTTVQRWSYESSWKSKEQKYSTQMSRSSNPCVRKIKVKASPMTSGRTTSSEK